ncbi:GatB/YqeY domain-containing protein [Nonlabens ulvanivorans]|uniref:GatB/YqeY domain-containing protein n=1 Tax=Nonlabens ulvanivorans TaxID=906888 RepID=UPI002942EF53|nr:GatB/YqeY domain-containing protein [Nonlabens ulvanivorans]WOI21818.1 GatB/YqeY domain-containing protein [Nonlabens ulvanivorans]
MSLEKDIMTAMKEAMKAKDQTALAALRAVKSELLLAKTSGDTADLSEEDEIKLVQKLVKQRKDSARIFSEQNREDLSEPELAQAAVLEQFLPEQLSEEEIAKVVQDIIAQTGAAGMKDMGKVMGMANQQLAGKADGRAISTIVKNQLT